MRTLLVAVNDSPGARLAFEYLLQDELRPSDQLHLLHVALRDSTGGGLPQADYFEQAHPATAQRVVQDMLQAAFLAPLANQHQQVQPVLHIVQAAQDAATVGRIICEKAVQLQADKVIIGCGGCSSRSKLAQLLSGHVSTYCRQHCSVPLVVVAAQDGGGGHVAHEVGGGGGAA